MFDQIANAPGMFSTLSPVLLLRALLQMPPNSPNLTPWQPAPRPFLPELSPTIRPWQPHGPITTTPR